MSDAPVWSNAPAEPLTLEALEEGLRAMDRALAALPPTVYAIDAPSTAIARMRREGLCEGGRVLGAIDLHIDNDLPRHTVRYHWTDGRTELVRLDTIDSAGDGGR